jgi:hypothetical protein
VCGVGLSVIRVFFVCLIVVVVVVVVAGGGGAHGVVLPGLLQVPVLFV